jgi:hypothetical protein
MFDKLVSFTKDVSDLADKPALNPSELKAIFDAAPDEVRVYLNKLIDALKLTTAGDSGAKNIGATAILGLGGTDVQTILESLFNYLSDHGIGTQSKGFTGDLNTLATAGNYTCLNTTNAPIANEYFFVNHYVWDNSSHMQMAVQLSTARTWVRTKNVNNWGAWNEK